MYKVLLLHCVGESVDDCGGGYSESVAEMCDELQNGSLPLLVLTPNGRDDAGTNKDCFLLNPAAKSSLHMEMFRFLGKISFIFYNLNLGRYFSLPHPLFLYVSFTIAGFSKCLINTVFIN